MFWSVGLLLIPSIISRKAVHLDKLLLIANNGWQWWGFCSCWNTFLSFVLAVVMSSLCTISRYLPISSVSLVCPMEIALYCWNKKIIIIVAIDPWMSGIRFNFNAKKLGLVILMRVMARCSLI